MAKVKVDLSHATHLKLITEDLRITVRASKVITPLHHHSSKYYQIKHATAASPEIGGGLGRLKSQEYER